MVSIDFSTISHALKTFDFPPCDVVVGIATGGMVPASLIAYQLDKPLVMVRFNFRDETNTPVHDAPVRLSNLELPDNARRLLLVDDVSVTGSTLEAARSLLGSYDVKTIVLKGKADCVLFPDIRTCVDWPWKTRTIDDLTSPPV